jgi:3-phosphoshikimate 1-carboxyvinyltransferase
MFYFKSDLILSKSWLNRALVIQSYQNGVQQNFSSESEDVIYLKKAIQQKEQTQDFDLGLGGTSFRFFCFLISRKAGQFKIKAQPRLLQRPQQDLQKILKQLGVDCLMTKEHLLIQSKGWIIPDEMIQIQAHESSQFISALVLNAWKLPKDLKISIQKPIASQDYFTMTLKLLKKAGLAFTLIESNQEIQIVIPKNQVPVVENLKPEVDVSSAFSLAAAAAIHGEIEITNWNSHSLQPDMNFLKIFRKMNISYNETETTFKITKQNEWKAVQASLQKCPDLFPVLAVLCALAKGTSDLFEAEQLQFKESNRLIQTHKLLKLTGFKTELKKDGILIQGLSSTKNKSENVIFNPDHDHRMAMAAGLLKLAGYSITIETPEVVQKSFPNFWKAIEIQP